MAAVLFVDLQTAFCSVVVALATGPTAAHDRHAALLDGVEAPESEATELLTQLREGKCELRAWCASAGSAGGQEMACCELVHGRRCA